MDKKEKWANKAVQHQIYRLKRYAPKLVRATAWCHDTISEYALRNERQRWTDHIIISYHSLKGPRLDLALPIQTFLYLYKPVDLLTRIMYYEK